MVQTFLDAGDDPTRVLTEAIRGHHTDIVRLLLESGATEYVNDDPEEVLVEACKRGNLDIIKLLLDTGADPLACRGKCIKLAVRKGMSVLWISSTRVFTLRYY